MKVGGIGLVAAVFLASLMLLSGCTLFLGEQGKTPSSAESQAQPGSQAGQQVAPAKGKVVGGEPPSPGSDNTPLVDVSKYPNANENQKVIKEVVGGYKKSDPGSFNQVSVIVALGPGALGDVLPLLTRENVYEQWTGVYAVSGMAASGNDAQKEKARQALLPLLKSKYASVRTLAAHALLALGDKSGFPVLIDSLGITDRLLQSEPPEPTCGYSNRILMQFSGQDFGFGCSYEKYDSVGKGKWQQWWQANGASLTYNKENGKYSG